MAITPMKFFLTAIVENYIKLLKEKYSIAYVCRGPESAGVYIK